MVTARVLQGRDRQLVCFLSFVLMPPLIVGLGHPGVGRNEFRIGLNGFLKMLDGFAVSSLPQALDPDGIVL